MSVNNTIDANNDMTILVKQQLNIKLVIINNNNESLENLYDRNDVVNPIYRFKFTENFMDELMHFSKIHQYDNRKEFKEAWELWVNENNDIVKNEIVRLTKLNYVGDINNKMYKSARYYFRTKSIVKIPAVARKEYISLDNDILHAMDEHIENNRKQKDYSPKNGYISFCNDVKYIETINNSIKLLMKKGIAPSNDISAKIKKTYKNRYSMFIMR